jgi:hypothetical protein
LNVIDAELENGGGRIVARGKTAEIGTTRVAKNGYHYTKTEGKWVLTHWLTAEEKLGRKLEENEMVKFKDPKFKHDPYNPQGIIVIKKKTTSLRRRKAQIEDRIRELQAELEFIDKQLDKL